MLYVLYLLLFFQAYLGAMDNNPYHSIWCNSPEEQQRSPIEDLFRNMQWITFLEEYSKQKPSSKWESEINKHDQMREVLDLSSRRIEHLIGYMEKYLRLREKLTEKNYFAILDQKKEFILKSLILKENFLSHIPQELYELKTLTKLSLAYNRLTHIPSTISALENLQQLDVSNNLLKTMQAPLANFKQLKLCNLANNQLEQFPDLNNIPYRLIRKPYELEAIDTQDLTKIKEVIVVILGNKIEKKEIEPKQKKKADSLIKKGFQSQEDE